MTLPDDIVLLDFARDRSGRVSAVRGDRTLEVRALADLDAFTDGAALLVGHGLLDALPALRDEAPGLETWRLPAVDTRLLAPLAFPHEHALGADDDDPRWLGRLLADAARALAAAPPWRASLSKRALSPLGAGAPWHGGFAAWFDRQGLPDAPLPDLVDALGHAACHRALSALGDVLANDAPLDLAVALARLDAPGPPALPAWVRRRHPGADEALDRLCEVPCGGCPWCAAHHDPVGMLPPGARTELHRRAAGAVLTGAPVVASMPGSAACFRGPALARHARRGRLTVVVCPDRAGVDGHLVVHDVGDAVAALHDGMPHGERARALSGVRDGTVGLLYATPAELSGPSLRDAVRTRELAGWILDDAHALCVDGHALRVDLLDVPERIRALSGGALAPVSCFAPPATRAVRDALRDRMKGALGQDPAVLAAPVHTPNVTHRVIADGDRDARIAALVATGPAVVFCETSEDAVGLAARLADRGLDALADHDGLPPARRRALVAALRVRDHAVLCTTRAEVLAPRIRTVVHASLPASPERYLQQASCAGRDGLPAESVLLYGPHDTETRFGRWARSRLTPAHVSGVLRSLRDAARRADPDGRRVVVDPGELGPWARDAVLWLERAGFVACAPDPVLRGRAVPAPETGLVDATAPLPDPEAARALHRGIARLDEDLTADALADLHGGPGALRTLQALVDAGLVTDGPRFTVVLRHKVRDPSTRRLDDVVRVERALLTQLSDAEDAPRVVSLRAVHQQLVDDGLPSSLPRLRRLLTVLSDDAPDAVVLRPVSRDRHHLQLRCPHEAVVSRARRRWETARAVLDTLLSHVPDGAGPGASTRVAVSASALAHAVTGDLVLRARLDDPHDAALRALSYLHHLGVVSVQDGASALGPALSLTLRRAGAVSRSDLAPLLAFDEGQRLRIHVVDALARRGLRDPDAAAALLAEWFDADRDAFCDRWFPGAQAALSRPTTEAARARLLDDLTEARRDLVTHPVGHDLLVLGGPGTGATGVLLRRCAWLLQVEREDPSSVLVLCPDRAAARAARADLAARVGPEAGRVVVTTLHGVALEITGRSVADARRGASVDDGWFDALLDEAVAVLSGATPVPGVEAGSVRDALLGRFAHVLVDEAQDLDPRQAALLDALVAAPDGDGPDVWAVGDPDRSIHGFRGAGPAWLHRFAEAARVHALTENLRSTPAIVAVANALSDGRLTTDPDAPYGEPVQRVDVDGPDAQAAAVLDGIDRLRALDPDLSLDDVAVLGRTHGQLHPVRDRLLSRGLPCRFPLGRLRVPLHRVREVSRVLDALAPRLHEQVTPDELAGCIDAICGTSGVNPWRALLVREREAWEAQVRGRGAVADYVDALWAALTEERFDQHLGRGVHLGTLHAARGRSFPHVFLLDGDGVRPDADLEAERRLRYVGLTRAERTLCVFHDVRAPGPFPVEGPRIRRVRAPDVPPRPPVSFRILDHTALDTDHAGRLPAADPVHARLAALQVGQRVHLSRDGGRLRVDSLEGPVAALSDAASAAWTDRLDRIARARVVAMVRWDAGLSADPAGLRVDRWELPVIELRVRG